MATLAPITFMGNQQQHPQHQQHQQNNFKVAANNKGPNDETGSNNDSLPSDLEKILAEVARNGGCSWLTWLGTKDPRGAAAAARTKIHRNNANTSNHSGSKRKRQQSDLQQLNSKHSATSQINSTATAANGNNKQSSGSRSGSEFEDSTHYECDSEGTSTTSNSEVSDKRLVARRSTGGGNGKRYKSLGHAFSEAIAFVLDHSYRHQGGYKLSPAEVRKYNITMANSNNTMTTKKQGAALPEEIFRQRRHRLMALVTTNQEVGINGSSSGTKNGRNGAASAQIRNGPPFTIQRLAEVLLSPSRYYRQTHKLCNCMEKLLLVSSSIHAFGGITGGQTSQSRREEREMSALAGERERHESEQRNRRIRRRLSPSTVGDNMSDVGPEMAAKQQQQQHHHHHHHFSDEDNNKTSDHSSAVSENSTMSAADSVAAQAKASLRQKFDHAALDPPQQQLRAAAIGGNIRSMATSPPPPSLAGGTPAGIAMSSHSTVASFVRHLTEAQQQSGIPEDELHGVVAARAPSPILFTGGMAGESVVPSSLAHPARGVHLLQMHHPAPLAPSGGGGSGNGSGVLDNNGAPTMDIVIDQTKQTGGGGTGHTNKEVDLDTEIDRSSASNSDVDSESDDFSLDDSASDRSDGSDTGSASAVYEPFSAARVIALNRMQQQQRLQQSRMQMLGEFRPPAESEYQSGDSIDSTMAEDSGGSDSSSSDIAD